MGKISKERSRVVSGTFTEEEEAVIREQAKRDDMTVSEYVRAAIYTSLIIDGNVKAMKLMGGLIATKVANRCGKLLGKGRLVEE